jgi:hypothetical protein
MFFHPAPRGTLTLTSRSQARHVKLGAGSPFVASASSTRTCARISDGPRSTQVHNSATDMSCGLQSKRRAAKDDVRETHRMPLLSPDKLGRHVRLRTHYAEHTCTCTNNKIMAAHILSGPNTGHAPQPLSRWQHTKAPTPMQQILQRILGTDSDLAQGDEVQPPGQHRLRRR